jgi:hypothetical protein
MMREACLSLLAREDWSLGVFRGTHTGRLALEGSGGVLWN